VEWCSGCEEAGIPSGRHGVGLAIRFAAANVCAHPRIGNFARHHLHEHSLQRQFKEAVRKAEIPEKASCHSMLHSFACWIHLASAAWKS
jgi:integrase